MSGRKERFINSDWLKVLYNLMAQQAKVLRLIQQSLAFQNAMSKSAPA